MDIPNKFKFNIKSGSHIYTAELIIDTGQFLISWDNDDIWDAGNLLYEASIVQSYLDHGTWVIVETTDHEQETFKALEKALDLIKLLTLQYFAEKAKAEDLYESIEWLQKVGPYSHPENVKAVIKQAFDKYRNE